MGFETASLKPENGKEIKVLFNPSEYNLSKSVNYTDKKVLGMNNPFLQFISGEAENLKITLMFDTYEPPGKHSKQEGGRDVRLETEKIASLLEIDPSRHRPPIVLFHYGSLKFEGVVTDVSQNFTMFLGDGRPVRAKLEVTFRSIGKARQEPLESPDRTKCRILQEGQRLWQFAWEEYGDPEMWKVIAKANQIRNPLETEPGTMLKLPAVQVTGRNHYEV